MLRWGHSAQGSLAGNWKLLCISLVNWEIWKVRQMVRKQGTGTKLSKWAMRMQSNKRSNVDVVWKMRRTVPWLRRATHVLTLKENKRDLCWGYSETMLYCIWDRWGHIWSPGVTTTKYIFIKRFWKCQPGCVTMTSTLCTEWWHSAGIQPGQNLSWTQPEEPTWFLARDETKHPPQTLDATYWLEVVGSITPF